MTRPCATRLDTARSLVVSLATRIERFFVPRERLADGSLDVRAAQQRALRIVGAIAGTAVVIFMPSLVVAGVPTDRWAAYTLGVVVAAVVISVSLIAVRPASRAALVAAAADAFVIAGLGWLIGDHYHQIALLFATVVAGHAAIHGLRAAAVMVTLGCFLVPLTITVDQGLNATDFVYAFIYLLAIALAIWTRNLLMARGAQAITASEAKYRELVERVPAVVYTADLGVEGAWRFVSPPVERLLGYPAEAWTGDPGFWWSRVHPDDRESVLAEEIETSAGPPGQPTISEYRMLDRDGRARWVRDEATLIAVDGKPSHWSGFLIDVTERHELEIQLEHQAFHDPLTGLANRALFLDRVRHAMARSDRRQASLAVLFLDLDDFKTINDGMGHEAGDQLLVAVGKVLLACVRPMDTAARLGGDEFAILLEDVADTAAASVVAERILAALSKPIAVHGRDLVIGASIGIAGPTARRETAAEILRNADASMYTAKRKGKGRYETYAPAMHEANVRRLELSGEIRQALELGEFTVHYQPIVRLSDGSISGFEALARWNHPIRGLVLPGQFIPAAEESGQIVEIGRFVLEEACRQAHAWRDASTEGHALVMSVNVSARQFRDESLCAKVAAAISASGLDPAALVLEITESVVMEDSEAALGRLLRLKALGLRLAIDDFGTGYSSLSYLRRLPVDILKVDKSFVDGISDGDEAFALGRVMVGMGRTFHLEVVAEGVELPSQAEALRQMGCSLAQGFHFAPPMAADDATMLLSRGRLEPQRGG